MRLTVPAALTIAALAVPSASAQKAGKTHTRKIFVSVTDRTGLPVDDVQPAEFDIREGGIRRMVVRAALATSPMRVVVLVDTSDAGAQFLNHIRAGLDQFFEALPAKHEAALLSTGRQMRVRMAPTLDRKKLRDTAAGLFTDGGGTSLMDGLLEADDRFVKKAEDRWPVFVVLSTDGAENSAGAHENEFNRWLESLRPRGITAHAVLIKIRGNTLTEIVANAIAENSDGDYITLNTSNSVPERMKALALKLGDQYQVARTRYEVEFTTDAPDTPPIDVGVVREGVTLRLFQTRVR